MSSEIALQEQPVITKGVSLTKEVALSIQNHVLSGKTYNFRDSNTIRLEDLGVVFPRSTYDNWINRDSVVPNTNKTLKQIVDEARAKRIADKRKKENDENIRVSRLALAQLLSLPIERTSVTRELKRNKDGKMRETKRTTIRDISAPLVHAKMKGITFALERLDPDYAKKDETVKHAHVVFSLADLRKHRNEQRTNQVKE